MADCAISSRITRSTRTCASCVAAPRYVSLAPQVFDLLDYLIRNRQRVVSKDDLIRAIWNGRAVSEAALTTRLNAVRSALADNGEMQRLIRTLPRKGFRFVGAVQEAQGSQLRSQRWYRRTEPRERRPFGTGRCHGRD